MCLCFDIDSNRMMKVTFLQLGLHVVPDIVGDCGSMSGIADGVPFQLEISKQSALAVLQYHRDNQHQSTVRFKYALA